MTTEILRNAILEQPDELDTTSSTSSSTRSTSWTTHERGTVWEESLIFAPPQDVRFIALSATDRQPRPIGRVDARDPAPRDSQVDALRRGARCPLVHRLHADRAGALRPGDRMDWVRGNAGADDSGARAAGPPAAARRDAGGAAGTTWRLRGPRAGWRPGPWTTLFDELQSRRSSLPALVFSFSRKDCQRLAGRNQHRQLLDAAEQERMKGLQRELVELFQLDPGELRGEVFQLASRGVAYHHAGMMPIHKEVVERLFTSGLLKLLFTTETFALGINMPARTVVFASLRKFDGVSFDYLRTRDYLQMAGRAGRQGIDREGLVVTHLEPRDLEGAPVQRLFTGAPEPVQSRFRLSYATILHLFGARGREGVREAWEKSFNQFQHRAKSQKARARNRSVQNALVDAHIALLAELSYLRLEEDRAEGQAALTEHGRVARVFYGYELQVTEFLFRGVFENLPPRALAMIFVGLVHEDRRRDGGPRVPARLFGGVRRHVDQIVRSLTGAEARHRIPTPLKVPDWGLTEPALLWFDGATFDEIEEETGAGSGDLVRTFRMAVQLMRQTRRVLEREDATWETLGEALAGMNRREVDARQQLELG